MENLFNFFLKVVTTLLIEEALVFFPLIFLFFFSIFTFKHKKNLNLFLKGLIYFFPIIYIFYVYSYLPDYFSSLGQDSLLEAKYPDFGEVVFFLKSFFMSLFDPEIFKRNRFWLVLLSSIISSLSLFIIFQIYYNKNKLLITYYNKFFNYSFLFVSLIVLGSFANLALISINSGKELKKYEKEFKEDLSNYSVHRKKKDDLIVVTYIGESTTPLNMQVYGYPFDNTPWLKSKSKDKNFLLFSNVYATATHTAPSLIDALSICTKNCDSFSLIEKKHIALTDIGTALDIETQLYSTQGSLGGHNLASKLVLDTNIKFHQESKEEKLLGNRYAPKIKDKEFFDKNYCKNDKVFRNNKPNLIFLHSYAGHGLYGGYSGYIDKGIKFSYPNYINKNNLLGKNSSNFNLLKEYDTAIKYIDQSLEKTVNCTFAKAKLNNRPAVFIYFSDHGESPASGRGHDSARLTYEMLHVPFIIIFNEKAYNLYKDKIEFLNKIKNDNASLNILTDIVLYLLEIDLISNSDKKLNYNHQEFLSLKTKSLLKRELLNNEKKETVTFWNSKSLAKNLNNDDLKNQDTSISLWQINNYLKSKKLSDTKKIQNLLCQHRANSFVLQFKASISIGCFETDIYYLKDKTLSTHGLKIDTNLIFDDFLKSNYGKNTVWMDSKNLNKVNNCGYAKNWLNKYSNKFESLLIEIPTSSLDSVNDMDWVNCIKSIDSMTNIEVGYYMNTTLLKKCSNDRKKKLADSLNCKKLNNDTMKVLNTTNINSITFDYKAGHIAVENDQDFNNLKWHTWHVDSVNDIEKLIKRKSTGIILLKNNKHLDNLN